MKNNNSRLIGTFILFMLALTNYNRLQGGENVRTVQFVSIWAIGALSAMLVYALIEKLTGKQPTSEQER